MHFNDQIDNTATTHCYLGSLQKCPPHSVTSLGLHPGLCFLLPDTPLIPVYSLNRMEHILWHLLEKERIREEAGETFSFTLHYIAELLRENLRLKITLFWAHFSSLLAYSLSLPNTYLYHATCWHLPCDLFLQCQPCLKPSVGSFQLDDFCISFLGKLLFGNFLLFSRVSGNFCSSNVWGLDCCSNFLFSISVF